MHEVQGPGMQQHAVHAAHAELPVALAVAVAGVADQVVAQMLEVAPDLAEAAGQRLALEQCVTRGGETGRRRLELAAGQAAEARRRRLLLGLAGPAVERMLDLELGLRRPASAQRKVT